MLVNNMEETLSKPHHCLLQPEVKVFSQNNDFIFIENKTDTSPEYMDDEEQGLAMLYRNKKYMESVLAYLQIGKLMMMVAVL